MRASLLLLPLLLTAGPALAAPAAAPVLPQVTDPRLADRLTETMQALSKAFLALPVGDIEAAVRGRKATPADKARTVATESGLSPQELDRRIAEAKPQVEAGINAMAEALPKITEAMSEARQAVERAAANMPSPDYPRR